MNVDVTAPKATFSLLLTDPKPTILSVKQEVTTLHKYPATLQVLSHMGSIQPDSTELSTLTEDSTLSLQLSFLPMHFNVSYFDEQRFTLPAFPDEMIQEVASRAMKVAGVDMHCPFFDYFWWDKEVSEICTDGQELSLGVCAKLTIKSLHGTTLCEKFFSTRKPLTLLCQNLADRHTIPLNSRLMTADGIILDNGKTLHEVARDYDQSLIVLIPEKSKKHTEKITGRRFSPLSTA